MTCANSVAGREQLLSTKLFIPRAEPGALERPQLSASLDEVKSYRLVMVSAPAGYGKTTLPRSRGCRWTRLTTTPPGSGATP